MRVRCRTRWPTQMTPQSQDRDADRRDQAEQSRRQSGRHRRARGRDRRGAGHRPARRRLDRQVRHGRRQRPARRRHRHPPAHPRCGARPLHRAGLRRHQPAADRRAAGRHQGGPLLPLRIQRGHPHGAAHAPARLRSGRPGADRGGAGHAGAVGASCSTRSSARCWPSARSSSCTSATRPPWRSCTARTTTPSTRTSRTSSAGSWATSRVPLRDRVRMAASFGVVFSSLFLAGDAFESTTQRGIGGHAPRHPPRRPRRMTGPVRRAKPQPQLATVRAGD